MTFCKKLEPRRNRAKICSFKAYISFSWHSWPVGCCGLRSNQRPQGWGRQALLTVSWIRAWVCVVTFRACDALFTLLVQQSRNGKWRIPLAVGNTNSLKFRSKLRVGELDKYLINQVLRLKTLQTIFLSVLRLLHHSFYLFFLFPAH